MKNLQRAKLPVARETLRVLGHRQLGLVAGGINLPPPPPPPPRDTIYLD